MKVLHLRCRFFVYHYQQDPQLFCHEVVMWKRLTHPNVLPLLGITLDPPQLILSWMPGGDLLEFIKNPDADRVALVGVPLPCLLHAHPHYQLSDAAKGLFYLHSCNMVHGDFKGVCDCSKLHFATVLTPNNANILVDDSGHARIADFGLAEITQNLESMQSTLRHGHTPRWTAPEILNGGGYSKEADIFSFAMVMIEVRRG